MNNLLITLYCTMWAAFNCESDNDSENGNCLIIVALALLVIVIVVGIPFLNQNGSANPGCLVVPNTPACK